jgi:hypothetical protein
MKSQRKIITNRIPLSENEILSQKETFSSVKEKFNKIKSTPKLSINKFIIYGIAASIALITIIILFYNQPAKENITASNPISCDTSFFKKPLSEMSKYQHFIVDNKKDVRLLSSKGSKIHIKANTFVDKNGKIVDGEVDVVYNEYHNPVELFLSGIPMKYDSAGFNYTFESAGMFEIYAKKDNEYLAMNENQPIVIDLVSSQNEPFNLYYYDTKENKWSYLNNEKAEDITENKKTEVNKKEQGTDFTISPESATIENSIESEKTSFIPRIANPDNFSFVIDIDADEFPEFAGYNNLLFEIDNSDSSFREEYYDVKWSKVDLKKLDNESYLIELSRLKKTIRLKAYPVLNKADYAEAIKEYNKNKNDNSANLAQNMKQISDKAEKQKTIEIQNKIISNFQYSRNISITNLGTYNCDRPIPYPELPIQISLNFNDKEGIKLNYSEVNIVQKGKNILWKYPKTAKSYISKSAFNIIWIVTDDNQFAIIEIPAKSEGWKRNSHTADIYSFKEGIEKISKLLDNG